MGGQEVLYYGAEGPSETLSHLRGIDAEAPYIRVSPATQPWKITVISGRIASKVIPNHHMVIKLRASFLSRDPEVNKKFAEDKLCHDTGTLEGLAGMIDRAAALDEGKVVPGKKVKSLWVGFGSGDEIVRCDAAKQFFDRVDIKDKTFKEYDGWYHVCKSESASG